MKNIFVFLCVLLVPSCKEIPSPPTSQVSLNLKIAPLLAGPGDPAAITAEVTNIGSTRGYRMQGCSFWVNGMTLGILDPGSNEVHLYDPRIRPLCPDQIVQFLPGEKLTGAAEFDGTLFTSSGYQFEAKSGTYTVVVKFMLSGVDHFTEASVIERRASFQWQSNHSVR